jgi:hypothetical protein
MLFLNFFSQLFSDSRSDPDPSYLVNALSSSPILAFYPFVEFRINDVTGSTTHENIDPTEQLL